MEQTDKSAKNLTVDGSRAAQGHAAVRAESRSWLGDLLLSDQIWCPEQLAEALNLQQESGRQLGTILVEYPPLDARSLGARDAA